MRTDYADNLFTIASFLSPEECRELIERGEGIGFEPATVAVASGARLMTNVRNNDRVTFDDPVLAEQLWDRARPYLPAQLGGATAIGFNERLRFYRYDASQKFNAHRDGTVERSATERSRLTFMIYLNEGSEGGQTVFYSEEREGGLRKLVAAIEPKIGTALCFAHEWWHEGAKVTSGRKYVIRTDVMYRENMD